MNGAWCRGVLWLLCGSLLWCALPAHAAPVQPAELESGSVIVIADTAEVREGPAAEFEVITVVGKGEIFLKAGRTGAWYYIKVGGDTFGWVNGRDVSRHKEGETPPPYVGPVPGPYPPGSYPYYYWGPPFFTWDWFLFDRGPFWGFWWDGGWDRHRDWHDRPWGDRPWGDRWRPDMAPPLDDKTKPQFNPQMRQPMRPPAAPPLREPTPRR